MSLTAALQLLYVLLDNNGGDLSGFFYADNSCQYLVNQYFAFGLFTGFIDNKENTELTFSLKTHSQSFFAFMYQKVVILLL